MIRWQGQISGLPLVWNCKHSREGSLGHSRKVLNWEFLEELLVCLHSSLWGSSANSVCCDHCPVQSENYMRTNEGQQMLSIPLQTVNWTVVTQVQPVISLRPMFVLLFSR